MHASVSIPLFFQPLLVDDTLYVDGGILSNFPSFLFSQSIYPTVGFKLRDIQVPTDIATVTEYIKSLILTMTDAHDKERELPQFFLQYTIDTPPQIAATTFNLII